MDSARAGQQGSKAVDLQFDRDCIGQEGFLVEGSNPIRSAEYYSGERFRGRQLQALSNFHQERAAGNGGGDPTYFNWPLPGSALEGMSESNSNNLGAWLAMEAGRLSSGTHAEMGPNVLLTNLLVLQQKALQLEAFVQEGRHEQPALALGSISAILYQLIVTASSVLFSVEKRETANLALVGVQPGLDRGSRVEIQAENRASPVGLGFGKLPNPNGASLVGFAGGIDLQEKKSSSGITAEGEEAAFPGDMFYKIIEINENNILAEHTHFCEICGKGFRRDANVRMHMRAHGDEYKTNQALMSRPSAASSSCSPRAMRYSCPFDRCKRNKNHCKFKPLKSVTCLRNHYKRSHCPKMYTCQKCKKQFSVVGDLKTHDKHCGHNPWRCSCGTTFTRKDKLFSHVALFQGHKPLPPDHELVLPPAPKRHKAISNGQATTGQGDTYVNDATITKFLAGDLAGLPDNKFQGIGHGDEYNLLCEPKVIQMGQNEVTIESQLPDSEFWADF